MKVTRMWCEWDIGCNDDVFEDEDVARKMAEHCLECVGIEETLEELEEEGLIGFEDYEVVTKEDLEVLG